MPLELEFELKSIMSLKSQYEAILSPNQIQILEEINSYAAKDDLVLSAQDPKLVKILIDYINKNVHDNYDSNISPILYSQLKKELDRQTEKAKKLHGQHKNYKTVFLHERNFYDWMEDHDLDKLMPKSTESISVMAPLDRYSRSSIQESLEKDLQKETIKHIIIPKGPGHWRGIYLSKPHSKESKYVLELFDSYGPKSAQYIEADILRLLSDCKISPNQIKIRYSTLPIQQKDAYSCGDFVCAYSHQKMRDFQAPQHTFNQTLIDTLNSTGNRKGALRSIILVEMSKLACKSNISQKTYKKPQTSSQEDSLKQCFSNSFSQQDSRASKSLKPPILSKESKLVFKSHSSSNKKLSAANDTTTGFVLLGILLGGIIGVCLLSLPGLFIGAAIGAIIVAGIATLALYLSESISAHNQQLQEETDSIEDFEENSVIPLKSSSLFKKQERVSAFFASTPPEECSDSDLSLKM